MKFKPINQCKLEYFASVYRYFKCHKAKTCEALDLNHRTAYTYIQKCKELKIELGKPLKLEGDNLGFIEVIDLTYTLPTNKERLKHLDGDNRFKGRQA